MPCDLPQPLYTHVFVILQNSLGSQWDCSARFINFYHVLNKTAKTILSSYMTFSIMLVVVVPYVSLTHTLTSNLSDHRQVKHRLVPLKKRKYTKFICEIHF